MHAGSLRKERANLRDVAKPQACQLPIAGAGMRKRFGQNRPGQAKIAEFGFVRSAAARAINSGRSNHGLIPTLDGEMFAQTIDAIESRLGDYGFCWLSRLRMTTERSRRARQGFLDIGVED